MIHKARRVVTGHDHNGHSIVLIDEDISLDESAPGSLCVARIWSTLASPADNNDDRDGSTLISTMYAENGSAINVVDFPPRSVVPLHRTNTIDYAVIMTGTIELGLDNGQTVQVEAGGVIVQRGSRHAWRNPTDQWVRMICVLLPANPVR